MQRWPASAALSLAHKVAPKHTSCTTCSTPNRALRDSVAHSKHRTPKSSQNGLRDTFLTAVHRPARSVRTLSRGKASKIPRDTTLRTFTTRHVIHIHHDIQFTYHSQTTYIPVTTRHTIHIQHDMPFTYRLPQSCLGANGRPPNCALRRVHTPVRRTHLVPQTVSMSQNQTLTPQHY